MPKLEITVIRAALKAYVLNVFLVFLCVSGLYTIAFGQHLIENQLFHSVNESDLTSVHVNKRLYWLEVSPSESRGALSNTQTILYLYLSA